MSDNLDQNQQLGQCRCCLDVGCHDDITGGVQQVYRETLADTFNLSLSTNPSLTTKICKSCIDRLNDATKFKAMVAESEQHLLSKVEGTVDIRVEGAADSRIEGAVDKSVEGATDSKIEGAASSELVDASQSGALEEKKQDHNSIIKKELINAEDENPSDIAETDPIIGAESSVPVAEVATSNDESGFVVTVQLEEITQENKQNDSAVNKNESKDNMEDDIDEQDDIDEENFESTSADSLSLLKSAFNYTSRNNNTGTKRGIKDMNYSNKRTKSVDKSDHSNKYLTNVQQGTKHFRGLRVKNEYVCTLCKYATNDENAFIYHIKVHTATVQYVCDACSYMTEEKKALLRHLRLHTDEFPLVRKICTYQSLDKLVGDNRFKFVDKNFTSRNKLTGRIRTHSSRKSYSCMICGEKFSSKGSLAAHNRNHVGDKPNVCKICNKKFPRKYNLIRHISTHAGEKPYYRKICDKIPNTDLKEDNRELDGEKPLASEICEENIPESANLKEHIKTDTSETPYACEICGAQFTNRNNLTIHISSHSGVKRFDCDICGKLFPNRNNLKVHVRAHAGVKPFACQLCDKKFTNRDSLRVHMRTHTGDKRFACHLCDKKFTRSDTLICHVRTHTGEKPYVCQICGEKFGYRGGLIEHKKRHEPDGQE